MILKPKPSEARYLIYVGAIGLAIAVLLWGLFFLIQGHFQLSFAQAIDCLKVWNSHLCADHYQSTLSIIPGDLVRRQRFIVFILIGSIALILIGLYIVGFMPRPLIIKAGRTVATMADLLKAASEEKISERDGLHWFNGWRLALERETRHFMIFGSIGGGKTQAMLGLILSAIARHDKALIFDIKGDFTAGIPKTVNHDGVVTEPTLIAPHDDRSVVWDVAKDLRVAEDAVELAARLIPDSRDRFFSSSARAVLAACIIRLMHDNPDQWTWANLLTETQRPASDLLEIAKHYHVDAVRFLDADYRQVSATLATLQADTTALRLLATAWKDYGDCYRFSLRRWLLYKTKRRTVILQRSGRFAEQSEHWISAFLTVAAGIISDPELCDAPLRRIWFFIDEFAQLPKIARFSTFLDIGRSKGVCVCLGIQDIAQIRHIYGREHADAWMSIVGTKIVTRVNSGPTANRIENDIGETNLIYFRRKYERNGEPYRREEKREYPFTRSELETHLGPTKKGIKILVLGIGKDIYWVTIPYITLKDERAAQDPAEWTWKLQKIYTLVKEKTPHDHDNNMQHLADMKPSDKNINPPADTGGYHER